MYFPTLEIITCPLEDQFHFYGNCVLDTCIYNSENCKNFCIKLGTNILASENKGLSVSEIAYYKYGSLDKNIIKLVTNEKKEALLRVQYLYTFNRYLEFIRLNYFDEKFVLQCFIEQNKITKKVLDKILNVYPFNIKLFKITYSDLLFILDLTVFEKFTNRSKLTLDIKLEELWFNSIKEERLNKARSILTTMKKESKENECKK